MPMNADTGHMPEERGYMPEGGCYMVDKCGYVVVEIGYMMQLFQCPLCSACNAKWQQTHFDQINNKSRLPTKRQLKSTIGNIKNSIYPTQPKQTGLTSIHKA